MPKFNPIQAPILPPDPQIKEKKLSPSTPDLKAPESLFLQRPDQHISTTKQAKALEEVFFVDQTEATELPKKIFSPDEKSQTIKLQAGERFAIKVNSNASTGYSWNVNGLKPIDSVYVPHYKGEGNPPPGSGGNSYYIFEAPQENAQIQLEHGRSWEKAEDIYSFDIQITDAQKSTKTSLPKTILQTDYNNPEQELHLKPGTRVAIEVDSNVSTGYSWQIDTGNIPIEELYIPAHKGKGSAPIGSGGKSYYVFTVPEHGKIELTHGQSWDKGSQRKYVFNINH